jgi:predicted nucleotidyltransferase
MQLHRPFAVITPTVDGDVLRVLALAEDEFTAPQVQRLIGHRSVDGVRRSLNRLAAQGIVTARAPSHGVLYRLNRLHLAASAVTELARLDDELLGRLRDRLAAWLIVPAIAALFGSAARAAMEVGSDVDLFVVRPPDVDADDSTWIAQLADLRRDVTAWTGNDTRILEYASEEVRRPGRSDRVVAAVRREGIVLTGSWSFLE